MSAFDRTMLTAGNKFKIIEFDSSGEGGHFKHEIEIDDSTQLVAVLIEGEISEPIVFLHGFPIEDDGNITRTIQSGMRTLLTKIDPAKDLGRVNLQFQGVLSKGARAKISVLILFHRIRKNWGPLSCTACKRIVRFLITAIITGLNIPDIPLDGAIPIRIWDLIKETGIPDIVMKLIEFIGIDFAKKFIGALRWLAGFLNEAFTPLDNVLTYICMRLGFCMSAN